MAAAGDKVARHPFVKRVAEALRHRCRVAGASRLIVATSGGADSVALLRAIAAVSPRRSWRLSPAVGHVQHHLRGQGAEADAQFVAALAERLELPFMRADVDLSTAEPAAPAPAAQAPTNLEARARQARYAALAGMAAVFDAPFVATAHHGDDQLETLVMRLLRGASVKGLAAMAWRRRLAPGCDCALVRPMLAVDRAAALAFLEDIDQPYRHDHTNADTSRMRARLRADVLPVLHSMRPDAARRAVATCDHLRHVGRLVEDAIDRAADHVVIEDGAATIDRTDARTLPMVVLVGLLRRLLSGAGVPADRLGTRNLAPIVHAVADTEGGVRQFNQCGQVAVTVDRNVVRVG